MVPRRWIPGLVLAAFVCGPATWAVALSKTYEFRAGTTLEMGVETDTGLRLDSVRFEMGTEGRGYRPGRAVRAEVTVSNLGTSARKIGIAIAVLDDADRLLGAASGGSRMLPLRPERQMRYTLVFDDVNAELGNATKFTISVEPRS